MKYIPFLWLSLLLFNCKTSKTQMQENEVSTSENFVGIVHVAEGGCPFYIEISETLNPGKTLDFGKVYPLNLKDGMKKKGLKVSFSYSVSKAMNPEGCTADAVVVLEQIEVIP
ncbi:MAG: hypothetical protein ACKO5L_08715 [Bacteroidota bacterium]